MRPEAPSIYVDRVKRALAAAALLDKPLDWLTQHSMPSFVDSDGDAPSFAAGTGLHARLWSVDDLQRLRHISLFRGLSKGELLTILNAGLLSEIPARRVLFHQGDHADRLYAVLEGEVEVFLPRAGGPGDEVLARVGAGAVFGELALILGGERNASVRTLSNVRALVLGKAELDLLLARPQRSSTALMLNIARSIGRTLQASQSRAFRVEAELRERVAELEARLGTGGTPHEP
jgi:CRP-like cAMP-binding protein